MCGQHVERPGARRAAWRRLVHVVGDAVLVELPRHAAPALRSSSAGPEVGRVLRERRPVRPRRAGGIQQLVEVSRRHVVVAQQVTHRGYGLLVSGAADLLSCDVLPSDFRVASASTALAAASGGRVLRSSVYGNSRVRGRAHRHASRRVAEPRESRQPPALRLVAVDRELIVVPSARMHHVILAAAERALEPRVDDVERERRVDRNRRMQRRRRLPRAVADAGDVLAVPAGRLQRHRPAVARDDVAVRRQARSPAPAAVRPTNRRSGPSCPPRLPRRARATARAPAAASAGCRARRRRRSSGKRNSKCGANHSASIGKSGARQLLDHVVEVELDEEGQHEAIVQLGAPAREARCRTARARSGRRARAAAVAARGSCARAAASRTPASRAARGGRTRCRASTACRCRTRRDACCRSRRSAGDGRRDRRATAGRRASRSGICANAISSS